MVQQKIEIHSTYSSVMYHFQDMPRYKVKSHYFLISHLYPTTKDDTIGVLQHLLGKLEQWINEVEKTLVIHTVCYFDIIWT